jgi:hypothetical protein
MGLRITPAQPYASFCADRRAITLFTATYLGVPVSTTHTITGHRRCRRGPARPAVHVGAWRGAW